MGLPYQSPYDDLSVTGLLLTGFCFLLPLAALIGVVLAVGRADQRRRWNYQSRPLDPAELAQRIDAISDPDLRARVSGAVREIAAAEPVTPELYDVAVDKAKDDKAAAAQLAAIGG